MRKAFDKIMQHMLFNETSRYIKIHGPQYSALLHLHTFFAYNKYLKSKN